MCIGAWVLVSLQGAANTHTHMFLLFGGLCWQIFLVGFASSKGLPQIAVHAIGFLCVFGGSHPICVQAALGLHRWAQQKRELKERGFQILRVFSKKMAVDI